MDKKRPGRALEDLEIQLPPLQKTFIEAVELMQQPHEPEFEQVLDLAEHDPAVVARLLRMVNSAYYSQRRPITSPHRALMIMGTVPVIGVVMGMSLQQAKVPREARGPSMQLIRHSVATAFLARHLLARDPASTPEAESQRAVFTAALLHDIGKLVLLYNDPGAAAAFYRTASGRSTPEADLLVQERAIFGYDHVEAGVYLSRRLQFPDVLTSAIAWHHRYGQLGPGEHATKAVVYPVAAANQAAKELGYALNHEASSSREADPWTLLLDEHVVGYESTEAMLAEVAAVEGELAAYVEAMV